MGSSLEVRFALGCAVFALSACASDAGTASRAGGRSDALRQRYEPVLVSLETELAAGDWRALEGDEARSGTTLLGVTASSGELLGFQRRWFSGRRGKVTAFSFTGRGSEVPLAAVYGPDKYSVARRVAFAVGEGTPARATLKVTLPSDGRYLLVVANVSKVTESTTTEPGRATAYLAEPEEEATCDCPCDHRRCFGDELWEVDPSGAKVRRLKDCAGRGERCFDKRVDGQDQGECQTLEEFCDEQRSCEKCGEKKEVTARYPNGTTVEEPLCGWCNGECKPNEDGECSESEEGDFDYDCSTDREPPPPPPPPPTHVDPLPPSGGPVQPAAKVVDPNCDAYLSASTCVRSTYCGWCNDGDGACVEGDDEGPDSGLCADGNWRYGL